MKKQTGIILGLIIVLLVVIFTALNMAPTLINFGFASVQWPLSIVIIGSLLVGAVVIFLLGSGSLWTQSRKIKQLKATLETEKNEKLAALSALEKNKKEEMTTALNRARNELQHDFNVTTAKKEQEIAELKAQLSQFKDTL